MRKLLLAQFVFTTGENKYNEMRLVIVNGNEIRPELSFEEIAVKKALDWFPKQFPESILISCCASDAIDNVSEVDDLRTRVGVVDSKKSWENESPLHGEFFDHNQKPFSKNGHEYTEDVLIDLDGNRQHFSIGYYHLIDEEWMIKDKEYDKLFDARNMKWTYLPLAKCDNK